MVESGAGKYLATVTSSWADKETFAAIKDLTVTVYSDSAGGAVEMTATELSELPKRCETSCSKKYCSWGDTCSLCKFCA